MEKIQPGRSQWRVARDERWHVNRSVGGGYPAKYRAYQIPALTGMKHVSMPWPHPLLDGLRAKRQYGGVFCFARTGNGIRCGCSRRPCWAGLGGLIWWVAPGVWGFLRSHRHEYRPHQGPQQGRLWRRVQSSHGTGSSFAWGALRRGGKAGNVMAERAPSSPGTPT
jgi:hypothetical protein